MNLQELSKSSGSFTDETISSSLTMDFANQAIAKINSQLKSKLPFFQDVNTKYTALDENWLRLLVGNYISYGIKLNNSSLSEADVYKMLFDEALLDAISDAESVILPDYRTTNFNNGVYTIDTSTAINVGWFGSKGV